MEDILRIVYMIDLVNALLLCLTAVGLYDIVH
jgi:hypothetical protein